MHFEWDEAKKQANLAKHGIDFADALELFSDPRHYIYPSRVQSDEAREVGVGLVRGRCIAIVFTRRGKTTRIISARVARRSERSRYER
jgi:uncharacterized DUF497 family protein